MALACATTKQNAFTEETVAPRTPPIRNRPPIHPLTAHSPAHCLTGTALEAALGRIRLSLHPLRLQSRINVKLPVVQKGVECMEGFFPVFTVYFALHVPHYSLKHVAELVLQDVYKLGKSRLLRRNGLLTCCNATMRAPVVAIAARVTQRMGPNNRLSP